MLATSSCFIQLWSPATVQPQLSRPHLSGPSIIQTSWKPENTLPCMCRRRDQWSFVGVVTGWVMSYGLCRLALGKTVLLDCFSEHCWPWSYCIVYRLGTCIINQVGNTCIGTSVVRTFHLSSMAAISPWTKSLGNRGCTVVPFFVTKFKVCL